MTPALFIIEMAVLSLAGIVYGVIRTGRRQSVLQKAIVYETPLPSPAIEGAVVVAVLSLLLVPCALVAALCWGIWHYDLGPSDGLVVAGIGVPLIAMGAIQVGVRLGLEARFARGHLRIDAAGLTYQYGEARGAISFDQPFVIKRALSVEPHRQMFYWVSTVVSNGKSTCFFYPAIGMYKRHTVWRWIDGTDGVYLGHHGHEVMRRLDARAERVEEAAPITK